MKLAASAIKHRKSRPRFPDLKRLNIEYSVCCLMTRLVHMHVAMQTSDV